MNVRNILMAGLMLVWTDIARAADVLTVQDVQVAPGESVTLAVSLDNTTTNLMGWQCDIVLPDGLSLALKANGKPAATLGERFAMTGHSISSTVLASGGYRFIATSMDGEAIPGSSGTLFTVSLKADASLTAGAKLTSTVKNIEFNTQDNQKLPLGDVTFSVALSGGEDPGEPTEVLTVKDVEVAPDGNALLDIALGNEATNLMGWQCDIVLPDGLSLALKDNGKPAATLGERFAATEHRISSSVRPNGDYRFIATSMEGEAIPGASGTLFTVTLKADASLQPGTVLNGAVKNIEFNTQDNKKVTLEDVTFTVTISDGKVTVALKAGWNWISGVALLDDVKTKATRILSQTQELVLDPSYGWVGNLKELLPTQMYKVLLTEDYTISLVAQPSGVAFNVQQGWNWMGYTAMSSMPLSLALSGLAPQEGDRCLSHADGDAIFSNGEWVGGLLSMQPGQGYMLFSGKMAYW